MLGEDQDEFCSQGPYGPVIQNHNSPYPRSGERHR